MFKMRCDKCKQQFDVEGDWWTAEGPDKCPCCGHWISRFPPITLVFALMVIGAIVWPVGSMLLSIK